MAKTVAEVEIEKPSEGKTHYAAGCFHKSDRVAISAGKRAIVFDPAKPDERAEFSCPPDVGGWLSHPLVVNPDDSRMASTASWCKLVTWEMATKKATAVSLIPDKVDDPEQWMSGGVAFGPKGLLIAWRTGSADEVPKNATEANVPADHRGVVRIELQDGKVVPLGMGHTIYTFYCAFDPTEAWLATVGRSRPDKPRPDGIVAVGELRVYHLPSKELAYREQLGDCSPTWVAFTPSGKRVVCATYDGTVKWWDVKGK